MKISTLFAQLLIATPLVAACEVTRDPCTCGDVNSCIEECNGGAYGRYVGPCYDRCYSAWGENGYCLSSDVSVNEEDVVNDEPIENQDPTEKDPEKEWKDDNADKEGPVGGKGLRG